MFFVLPLLQIVLASKAIYIVKAKHAKLVTLLAFSVHSREVSREVL